MEHAGRIAFRHAIQQPDDQIDLIAAALAVAQEDLDLFDVSGTRELLVRLAERTSEQVGPPEPTVAYAERLVRYLHAFEGYAGKPDVFGTPASSYLPLVCQQRSGLPITLSLILLTVGEQLGLSLEPAALPAHFMVRWTLPAGSVFLDLFWGQVLDAANCRVFLQTQTGSTIPDPDLLPATSRREVVARLLRNLKHIYVRSNDFVQALAAAERIVMVMPDSIDDVRDRGFLRIRTGDLHRGMFDLERYAAEEPMAFDQPLIKKQMQTIAALLQGRS